MAQWADHQWNPEWADNPTRLRIFIPETSTHPLEWPSQEESGSGLTASAPVRGVSALACTNGLWPPLRPVSVAQKNKQSTMLSFNVQSIDLPMDCMAWRFWTMRQPNGCSTSAPRSNAAKQWFEQLAQKKMMIPKRRSPAGRVNSMTFQIKVLFPTYSIQTVFFTQTNFPDFLIHLPSPCCFGRPLPRRAFYLNSNAPLSTSSASFPKNIAIPTHPIFSLPTYSPYLVNPTCPSSPLCSSFPTT